MDNVYYLNSYLHSKKMVRELPIIINKLDKLNEELSHHGNYFVFIRLRNALNEASLELQYNYRYYREIYDRKGKDE